MPILQAYKPNETDLQATVICLNRLEVQLNIANSLKAANVTRRNSGY